LSLLSLAELRAEAAARHVVLVGHRGRKQTYIDAIEREHLLTLDDILGEWSTIVRRASDASRPSPRLPLHPSPSRQSRQSRPSSLRYSPLRHLLPLRPSLLR
jgi:hypothetical protein